RKKVSRASIGHNGNTETASSTTVHSSMRQVLALSLLAILVFLIYSNTLEAPFTFDDVHNIRNNPHIRLTELTVEGLTRAALKSPASNRPAANISFALNYYFHQYDVTGYHLVNILIHITTGILLYFFAETFLHIPSLRSLSAPGRWVPFFAAFLWLVHPIHTQSVSYVVQRMNSMAAMFYVLSLLLYAKGRLAGGKSKKWVLFAGSAVVGLLALGSKEIAATLPVFVLLYEWYFFQGLSKAWLKRHWAYLVGMAVLFAFISLLFLGLDPLEKLQSGGDYARNEFTFEQRVLTQSRVIIYYLSLLLFPLPSRLNLDYDFPLSHSLMHPVSTLLSAGTIIALIGLACGLARRERLTSFCILWFMGNLAIESSVIPLAVIFEHRTYLPSMFVSLLVVTLAYRHTKLPWVAALVLCAMAAVGSVWTYERNGVWSEEVTLWSDCVKKSPQKARPHNNLGYALRKQERLDEAVIHYREALRIKPDYPKAHSNLGASLALQGRLEEAIGHHAEALRIDPDFAEAHSNLGSALASLGRFEEAASHCYEALRIDPDFAEAHSNLGSALSGLGRFEEAASHCYEALRIDPQNPDKAKMHWALASALAGQGEFEEAVTHFSLGLKIKPHSADAHNDLGLALIELNRFDEAINHFSQALKIAPEFAEAHHSLGLGLARQGKLQASMNHFSQALRIRPDYGQAHYSLGLALALQGRRQEAIRHFTEALAINPNHAQAHLNLGALLAGQGRLEEGIGHFSEALRIDPDFAEAKRFLKQAMEEVRKKKATPDATGGDAS
ncbi:MAG: tetratricopeptide repeat protein, partial [Thermodesulfobacteriota bacterium]|nr:tetratricopeptide repeat protein [Thermodesulfobacteriota bacterium]